MRGLIFSLVAAVGLLNPKMDIKEPIELPDHIQAAVEEEEPELISGYATAYCLKGKTASGEYVREGICASSSGRLGDTIILYQRLPDNSVGEIIGYYECRDTGGSKAIKNGKLIDVWRPDLDSCQDFMDRVYEDGCKGHVWIQVIKGGIDG